MRIWTVPYRELDGKRLLGQHNEVHMLRGWLLRGRTWPDPFGGERRLTVADLGYVTWVHELTVTEMRLRGWYGHKSPMEYPPDESWLATLDRVADHRDRAHPQRERDHRDLWERWGGEYRGHGEAPSWVTLFTK